jgi:uroporphyrinogen-III decarboxylase
MEVTGRDRLLRTLRRERVDRIPVCPFVYYNSVYEMFGYSPNIENFTDPEDFDVIAKFVEFHDYFGFDMMHTLGSAWDAYSIKDSSENWDVFIIDDGDELSKQTTTVVRTPAGELRKIENWRKLSPYLVVSATEEYPVKTPADFEILRKYAPPPGSIDCGLVRRAKQAVGDKGLTCSCTHGAFNVLNQFRKLEDLMMDPLTDEGFYREMMEFFVGWLIEQASKLIEAGADAIELGANMATSGVGPAFFEDYVLEYEKRVIDGIHRGGGYVIYHNCGDAAKIMHLYNLLNTDVWGYLTPPPYGDVDLDEALRVVRPDMVLRGNIDQVDFLVKSSPKEIKERVRELLGKVKSRGNFILSTTDLFSHCTPYENIQAFAEAGLEFGNLRT